MLASALIGDVVHAGTAAGPQPDSGASVLAAVACPNADTCYAVGTSVSCSGGTVCDRPETASIFGAVTPIVDGAADPADRVGGASFHGIGCPTPDICYAVGDTGTRSVLEAVVVPLTDGVASAPIDSGSFERLSGIACPQPDTCIAVGATFVVPLATGNMDESR